MTTPIDPRTSRLYHAAPGSAFTALGAFGVLCAAAATLLVSAVVATWAGAPAMVAAVVIQASMLVVAVIAMRLTGRTPAALGLRRPAARYLAAGVLIGISAWYLNMRMVDLLPVGEDEKQLLELIDRPSLGVVLLAIALAPALCEEVLFRGVLVRGLATRLVPIAAILLSALLFSLYHVRPAQMPATFTLGVVFGWLALRSDSAIPTMVAHLLNNTIALLVARGDAPELSRALGAYPYVTLAGAVTLTGMGIALVARGKT